MSREPVKLPPISPRRLITAMPELSEYKGATLWQLLKALKPGQQPSWAGLKGEKR